MGEKKEFNTEFTGSAESAELGTVPQSEPRALLLEADIYLGS